MIGLVLVACAVAAVWDNPTVRLVVYGMGGLFAFAFAFDYGLPVLRGLMRSRRQMQTPLQRELDNAGRGAGLLALLALALSLIGWPRVDAFLTAARTSPDLEHGGAVLALGAVAAVGLILFFTGTNRAWHAAGERDVRLISWALVRLSLGSALWWLFWHPPVDWVHWVAIAHALPYSDIAVMVLSLWLVVPAAVRLLLILLGGGQAARIIRKVLERRNAPMIPATTWASSVRGFFFWFWR